MTVLDRVEINGPVERHDAQVGRAKIWFYVDHSKRLIDLSSLRVSQRERGKGEGGRALAYVLAMADKLGYPVWLAASPLDRRTTTPQLVRFYERRGFRPTGRHINPLGDPEMMRLAARDRRR